MVCVISALAVRIDEPQALPALFGEALAVFGSAAEPERVDITLYVRNGCPDTGEPLLSSGVLTVLPGEGGTMVFRFSRKTLCALAFDAVRAEATAYLYEGCKPEEAEVSEQLRVLFRMVFEQVAASKSILSLHASVFVYDKRAVCVTGVSGAGKSTLTENWMRAVPGSFVLNADRPLIRLHDAGATVFGAPWSGSEKVFINDSAPLSAIVEVRQHCINKIVRLSAERAYRLLLGRVSKPLWNAEKTGEVMELIEQLIRRVPVYRVYCTNSPEAGEFLHRALENGEAIPMFPEGEKEMKIKSGFVVRKALDSAIAVPVGNDAASAQGAVMLNELGTFIWEKLKSEVTRQELMDYILAEYDIDEQTASRDLEEFLDTLRGAHVLEEE